MQMQELQIESGDFLGKPEAKELVNLTAAKENHINIEKPNEYYLFGDDETDMRREQNKVLDKLEDLSKDSSTIKFCINFKMSNDNKNFLGHATGLKITEIDGRKTIHFYDPNYGQMSGEFNEQTVDDIFKILKDYGKNFGKNIQLLLYPITKEADAAQQP